MLALRRAPGARSLSAVFYVLSFGGDAGGEIVDVGRLVTGARIRGGSILVTRAGCHGARIVGAGRRASLAPRVTDWRWNGRVSQTQHGTTGTKGREPADVEQCVEVDEAGGGALARKPRHLTQCSTDTRRLLLGAR